VSFLAQEITPDQQRPLVAVNQDAIVERNGHAVVFVLRDGHAAMVPVTRGAKIGDTIAVEGDVRTGEKAVDKPAPSLADGMLVQAAAAK